MASAEQVRDEIQQHMVDDALASDREALAHQLRAIAAEASEALAQLEKDGSVHFSLNQLPQRVAESMCRNAKIQNTMFLRKLLQART